MPTKKMTQKPKPYRRRASGDPDTAEREVIHTSVYLPADLYYRMAELAARLRMAKYEVYEQAIAEWLERHESETQAAKAKPGKGGRK